MEGLPSVVRHCSMSRRGITSSKKGSDLPVVARDGSCGVGGITAILGTSFLCSIEQKGFKQREHTQSLLLAPLRLRSSSRRRHHSRSRHHARGRHSRRSLCHRTGCSLWHGTRRSLRHHAGSRNHSRRTLRDHSRCSLWHGARRRHHARSRHHAWSHHSGSALSHHRQHRRRTGHQSQLYSETHKNGAYDCLFATSPNSRVGTASESRHRACTEEARKCVRK